MKREDKDKDKIPRRGRESKSKAAGSNTNGLNDTTAIESLREDYKYQV